MRSVASGLIVRLSGVRTALMSTAGFGCLTGAAWTVAPGLGLAAAGVSLLLLEALGGEPERPKGVK